MAKIQWIDSSAYRFDLMLLNRTKADGTRSLTIFTPPMKNPALIIPLKQLGFAQNSAGRMVIDAKNISFSQLLQTFPRMRRIEANSEDVIYYFNENENQPANLGLKQGETDAHGSAERGTESSSSIPAGGTRPEAADGTGDQPAPEVAGDRGSDSGEGEPENRVEDGLRDAGGSGDGVEGEPVDAAGPSDAQSESGTDERSGDADSGQTGVSESEGDRPAPGSGDRGGSGDLQADGGVRAADDEIPDGGSADELPDDAEQRDTATVSSGPGEADRSGNQDDLEPVDGERSADDGLGADDEAESVVQAGGDDDAGALDASDPGLSPEATPAPVGQDFSGLRATLDDIFPEGIGTFHKLNKNVENINAIKVLADLRNGDRLTGATPEEQEILARYVGYAGIGNIFEGWSTQAKQLAELKEKGDLSETQFASMKASIATGHHTSPEVIDLMWQIADQAGFKGGKVLEPSAGIGHFVGLMPENLKGQVNWTLVEKDIVSAGIAKALYPSAIVHDTPFEKTGLAKGQFDLVIGGVPSSPDNINDPQYNQLNIRGTHNYFVVKNLDLLKEGGLSIVLASPEVLDSRSNMQRRQIAARGDLLAAFRFPMGTFSQTANTRLSYDLLVFKRENHPERLNALNEELPDWARLVESYQTNPYFEANPNHVLGDLDQAPEFRRHPEGLTFSREISPSDRKSFLDIYENTIRETESLDGAFAVENVETPDMAVPGKIAVKAERLTYTIRKARTQPDEEARYVIRLPNLGKGNEDDGSHDLDDVELTASELGEDMTRFLNGYITLRDSARTLISLESDYVLSVEEDEGQKALSAEMRSLMNLNYDALVNEFGPLNGRKCGRLMKGIEDRFQEKMDASALLVHESGFSFVKGLEKTDGKTVAKSDLFKRRVIRPTLFPESVESAQEAMEASLSLMGRVDEPSMCKMLGLPHETPEETRAAFIESVYPDLRERIFLDPVTRTFQISDLYLSGDVREKMDQAKIAVADDEIFKDNITELEKIMPETIRQDEIYVTMASPWIDLSDIQNFIASTLSLRDHQKDKVLEILGVQHSDITNNWLINSDRATISKIRSSGSYLAVDRLEELSSGKMNGLVILNHALNGTQPRVFYREIKDGPRILDVDATLAAQNKVNEVNRLFVNWIWSDEDRANHYVEAYNRIYNSIVRMKPDGSHLTFPGMSADIELRPHQVDEVWRSLLSDSGLFAHEVGTGKTFTMIASAMEHRRLDPTYRPSIVVPKAVIEQFTKAAKALYPGANILAINSKDVSPKSRAKFLASMAAQDFDLAIMTYESFGAIPVNPEHEERFIRREMENLEAAILEMKDADGGGGDGRSHKRIIKNLENNSDKLKARLEKVIHDKKRDLSDVYFEDLGIRCLYFDEAHFLKNIEIKSSTESMTKNGSQRAMDAMMKMDILRELGGITGKKPKFVFATGTPVSNSITECYGLIRMLDPECLERLCHGGIHFDRWASVFVDLSNKSFQMGADGSFKEVVNIRGMNTPELLNAMSRFMRTISAKETGIVRPDLEQITISSDPNEIHEIYSYELIRRARKAKGWGVGGDLKKDNMLKILSDAKKMMEPQLIDPRLPDFADTKTHKMVENIMKEYRDGEKIKSAQVVFCDLGVPPTGKTKKLFNMYDFIKGKLIAEGMKPEEIAYIHEAKTDLDRERLFDRVNKGEIRVLIGSTEKMGTGANFQKRLVALHQLDPPSNMRPSDVEQRLGRIHRQGNDNEQVRVYNYVTKDTFDLFYWQMIERKRAMIHSVLFGDPDKISRTVDESDDVSYEEIVAASTGETAFVEKMEAEKTVRDVTIKLDQFMKSQARARYKVNEVKYLLESNTKALDWMRTLKENLDQSDAPRTEDGNLIFTVDLDSISWINQVPESAQGSLDIDPDDHSGAQPDEEQGGDDKEKDSLLSVSIDKIDSSTGLERIRSALRKKVAMESDIDKYHYPEYSVTLKSGNLLLIVGAKMISGYKNPVSYTKMRVPKDVSQSVIEGSEFGKGANFIEIDRSTPKSMKEYIGNLSATIAKCEDDLDIVKEEMAKYNAIVNADLEPINRELVEAQALLSEKIKLADEAAKRLDQRWSSLQYKSIEEWIGAHPHRLNSNVVKAMEEADREEREAQAKLGAQSGGSVAASA